MINKKQTIIQYMLLFLTLFVFSIIGEASSFNKSYPYCRQNYKDTLYKVAHAIIKGDSVNDKTLLYCIPQSKDEASAFFSLDYSKNKNYNQAYREFNKMWEKKCVEKPENFIVKYFEFSKFVDGYFAEDYYINIQKIYKKAGNTICPFIKKCNQEKIKRLLIFLKENSICN